MGSNGSNGKANGHSNGNGNGHSHRKDYGHVPTAQEFTLGAVVVFGQRGVFYVVQEEGGQLVLEPAEGQTGGRVNAPFWQCQRVPQPTVPPWGSRKAQPIALPSADKRERALQAIRVAQAALASAERALLEA